MSRPFPYTYVSCPCSETRAAEASSRQRPRDSGNKKSLLQSDTPRGDDNAGTNDDEEEEQTFDPRSPRANFSLFPPEQLLYCEDCHQIKCSRCITEEIVCWYCPNCLFETPSSMVRSEGNRCARNCFNCPVCTAPLAVSTLENTSESASQQGPWILACGYCMWTTLDIGVKFQKPTNIRAQLARFYEDDTRKPSQSGIDIKSPLSSMASAGTEETQEDEDENATTHKSTHESEGHPRLDPNARFAALKRFYVKQLEETSVSSSDPLGPDFGASFSSPSALNRIMSIYTSSTLSGLYGGAAKKPKSKPPVMREALTAAEGLQLAPPDGEMSTIKKILSEDGGWDGSVSIEQRAGQSPEARFVDDLRPLPVLLRTKRSKRCKSCKHILVKPEFKPASTRFRIRLIALSYIPLPTLRLLNTPSSSSPTLSRGASPASTTPSPSLDSLTPHRPVQFLLTLKNHMFDPVKVTLATPSLTPGRISSKVTILCPQFDLGANSDVWDEALQGPTGPAGSGNADRSMVTKAGPSGEKVAEAGKVWDKGRNWTTVVLEVIPGPLPKASSSSQGPLNTKVDDGVNVSPSARRNEMSDNDEVDTPLREDEDVLEIPVFVRLEWTSENQMEQQVGKGQKPEMVRRELAYWMVLGVGRIAATD